MESKVIKYFILSILLFSLTAAEDYRAAPQPKLIRVAILKDSSGFTISIKGKFGLLELPLSGAMVAKPQSSLAKARPMMGEIKERKLLRESKVEITAKGFKIGDEEFSVSRLKFIPRKDATVYINGRRLRGEIDIIKSAQGRFLVVNTVELENYIKGVMYHEVSHHWPLESLKAQAVVARSYALYQMKMNQRQKYDLTNDVYSQVYGGRTSEKYRTNMAVAKTKGLVVTYQGKIFPTYYHATCAGKTENASELWKTDLSPLQSVTCDYCTKSPHYHWKRNFRLKDIQDKLNNGGYALGLIKDVAVVVRNPSGRIKSLEMTTRDDKKIQISGKDFRDTIGPNLIKSNNYEIIMKGYYMDLVGKGWGHGVGMCQWGAKEMARQGHGFEEILKYYYPGVEITNAETAGL